MKFVALDNYFVLKKVSNNPIVRKSIIGSPFLSHPQLHSILRLMMKNFC